MPCASSSAGDSSQATPNGVDDSDVYFGYVERSLIGLSERKPTERVTTGGSADGSPWRFIAYSFARYPDESCTASRTAIVSIIAPGIPMDMQGSKERNEDTMALSIKPPHRGIITQALAFSLLPNVLPTDVASPNPIRVEHWL